MEFEPRDRAVYVPASETLVCADLHVGRDAASNVELRLGEHEDLTGRFGALLERYEPAEAVVAGDLLHSFGGLPTGVMETVRGLRRAADAVDCRVVVTPGNHDTMLEELWEGPIEAEYCLGRTGVVAAHGHVLPETDAECYIVGHDHPTIEIEGSRRPCYLYGPDQYEGAGVLMLPSFSRLPAGVAVNEMRARDFQSPLVTDADALRPVVRDEGADETHEFPPLGEFRRML
jgi:putative SbcD/Mre11-related phosphoesterase